MGHRTGYQSWGWDISYYAISRGHSELCVVLATGPNSRVGSGFGSTQNRTFATGLTTRKSRTVGNMAVLPPKTRHFKSTIFTPIKYLSSDHIMTWSVRKLSSSSPSFTSRIQICDRTNICGGAVENPRNWLKNRLYFTATQRISVQSQIWMREVEDGLELHNVRTDHVTIRSELIYLIVVRITWSVKLNRGPGSSRTQTPGLMSGPGMKPAKTGRFRLLGGSWPGPGPSVQFQPGPKPGNPEPLLTLSMWSMNSVPDIEVCWCINTKAYQATISSPLQPLQDRLNLPFINMICPPVMKNI